MNPGTDNVIVTTHGSVGRFGTALLLLHTIVRSPVRSASSRCVERSTATGGSSVPSGPLPEASGLVLQSQGAPGHRRRGPLDGAIATIPATLTELEGDEYATEYAGSLRGTPEFQEYEAKTQGRQMPLFRCRGADGAPTFSVRRSSCTEGMVDYKLELVFVPVSDVDRSRFSTVRRWGGRSTTTERPFPGLRFIQVTPPGSPLPLAFGEGIVDAPAGSVPGFRWSCRRPRKPTTNSRRAASRSATWTRTLFIFVNCYRWDPHLPVRG